MHGTYADKSHTAKFEVRWKCSENTAISHTRRSSKFAGKCSENTMVAAHSSSNDIARTQIDMYVSTRSMYSISFNV